MSRTDSSGQDGLHYPRCNTYCRPGVHHLTDGIGLPHLHQTNLGAVCGECVSDHPATPTEETAEVADEDRDALVRVLAAHQVEHRSIGDGPNTSCSCGGWREYVPFGSSAIRAHRAHLAAVLAEHALSLVAEVADEDEEVRPPCSHCPPGCRQCWAPDCECYAHQNEPDKRFPVVGSDWLRSHDAALTANAKADAWDEARKAKPQYLGPDVGHYEDCMGYEDCHCASYPNPYREASS